VYGGSDARNMNRIETMAEPAHNRPDSMVLTLPPLSCLLLAPEAGA
jgi:hypothetical protein